GALVWVQAPRSRWRRGTKVNKRHCWDSRHGWHGTWSHRGVRVRIVHGHTQVIDLAGAPVPFASPRRFRRRVLIMAAGTRADTVYLLRTGQARVFLAGKPGHETTTAVLGPGQLVGVSALLGYPEHHASAEALTPVEAWALPAGGLLEHLPRDPALL